MSTTPPKTRASKASRRSIFPPRPRGMKGRSAELGTLARTITATRPTRIALVGPGGSGKSMLAAALGPGCAPRSAAASTGFAPPRWGFYTLSEMLALRFGTGRGDGRVQRLRRIPVARSAAADRARQPRRRRAVVRLFEDVRRLQGDVRDHRAPLPARGRVHLPRRCAARHLGRERVSARGAPSRVSCAGTRSRSTSPTASWRRAQRA